MRRACKNCDWGENSDEVFLYCNNPARANANAIQTAEEDEFLVDREDVCSQWVQIPGDESLNMGALE